MKIIFLCGSLEPGRDGVGDYTRRLAGELIRQGHEVQIITLFDQFITMPLAEVQLDEEEQISTIRFPAAYSLKQNIREAKKRVEDFNPDWISLQFVPYAFQAKGLPFSLASELAQWSINYKWHIMFHELWIGINGKLKFNDKIIGFAQKILIQRLIDQCQPSLLTTSIPIYQRALNRSDVKILPLFSNIPLKSKENIGLEDENVIKIVHFGAFTEHLPEFSQQLVWIARLGKVHNKKIIFQVIGNQGPYTKQALLSIYNILGDNALEILGSLSSDRISGILQSANLGISKSNYDLLGKSGSTVAMLEHGLPVLLRGVKPVKEAPFGSIIYFAEDGIPFNLPKNIIRSNLGPTAQVLMAWLAN